MTAEEAKDKLESILEEATKEEYAVCYVTSNDEEELKMAIEALEKQIAKKPQYTRLLYKCKGKDIEIRNPECPYCRNHGLTLWDASISKGGNFCKRCGQSIDWQEDET